MQVEQIHKATLPPADFLYDVSLLHENPSTKILHKISKYECSFKSAFECLLYFQLLLKGN